MTDLYSKIVSTGSYLPQKIYTNHDIEKLVDTSHDWIVERTGIISRHIADENESSVDMAYEASCKALERSNLKNNDIDLIFERDPMEALVRDKQMMVYEHSGFWQPMDTHREYLLLNELCSSERAPWIDVINERTRIRQPEVELV